MQQVLTNIKEVIESNTIIAGEFNILLTSMSRSSKQNQQGTLALNDT